MYKPADEHEIAERLTNSLQSDDEAPRNAEEYEVVSRRIALPPRTLPPRTLPLTIDQWANFFDESGAIPESEIVQEMIFHGVRFLPIIIDRNDSIIQLKSNHDMHLES